MIGLDGYMFSKDNIANVKEGTNIIGIKVQMGLPFYRSIPVSCIEQFDLALDGQSIKPDEVFFEIKNKKIKLTELTKEYQTWWCPMDKPHITIKRAGGLTKGVHKIYGKMKIRWPILKPASWDSDEGPLYDIAISDASFMIN